jgi:hypothetical protein
MRFVTNDGRLPSSMVVRTPPVQIYTSTLTRRERAWRRGGRGAARRDSRRRRRARARDLALLLASMLLAATVLVAVLAPAAS